MIVLNQKFNFIENIFAPKTKISFFLNIYEESPRG